MLANGDDAYFEMLLRLRELEREYEAVLGTLTPEQQDVVCDFVSQCEAMNRRMLEIACTHMKF